MKSSKQPKSVRKTERKMRRAVNSAADTVAELAERRCIGEQLASCACHLTHPDFGLDEAMCDQLKKLRKQWHSIKLSHPNFTLHERK